jgi:hypothetical protein
VHGAVIRFAQGSSPRRQDGTHATALGFPRAEPVTCPGASSMFHTRRIEAPRAWAPLLRWDRSSSQSYRPAQYAIATIFVSRSDRIGVFLTRRVAGGLASPAR